MDAGDNVQAHKFKNNHTKTTEEKGKIVVGRDENKKNKMRPKGSWRSHITATIKLQWPRIFENGYTVSNSHNSLTEERQDEREDRPRKYDWKIKSKTITEFGQMIQDYKFFGNRNRHLRIRYEWGLDYLKVR